MHLHHWCWLLLTLPGFSAAATLWTGPTLTFTKSAFANPMLAINQDRLTDQVWLTRASTQGPFNVRQEPAFQTLLSPVGTAWAFGTLAQGVGTLSFDDWQTTVGSNPQTAVNRPLVVHLTTDDIYLDLTLTTFGGGNRGGAFAYSRSSPVPLPMTLPGLLAGLGVLMRCRHVVNRGRGRRQVPAGPTRPISAARSHLVSIT